MHEIDDAIKPARYSRKVAREWFGCPNVLLIPYYLTANKQSWVVDRLCDHIGAAYSRYRINAKFARDKATKITEFHKGVADRFLVDLTPAQILYLSDKLAPEIADSDALTARCMNAYGFRLLYQHLKQERDRRLAELGV